MGSIPAATYDIFLNHKDGGLIGTATTGVALSANALAGDAFTNRTGAPLQVVWDVTPVSSDGCRGDVEQVTLTVNPEPVLAGNLNKTVCSGSPGGLTLAVASGSVPASGGYNILHIQADPQLTPVQQAGTGFGLPPDTLAGDVFLNTTAGPLTVVYTVVPVSAGGCEGDSVQVTLTVNPQPVPDPGLDAFTCSDQPSGITLKVTPASVAAQTYDITAVSVDPLLTNAAYVTPGTGYASDAIANDHFTNTTANALPVTYTVVPVSAAGCAGDTLDVILMVHPEPVIVDGLDTNVCSGAPAGIVLAVDNAGVPASSYTITAIDKPTGLTGGAVSPGNGYDDLVIVNETFVNLTPAPLTVVYHVLPVGPLPDGCTGDEKEIRLTVNPEPVLDPNLSVSVCSDAPTGITMKEKAGSVTAVTFHITAINADASLIADTANAQPGDNQLPDAIFNDRFTNVTNGPLDVVYDVIPVSAEGCEGAPGQITVTVNPEPKVAPDLSDTVCSRDASGITLAVAAGSVPSPTFILAGVDIPPAVTADASNALPGNGKPPGVIFNDRYSNTSGADQTVTYYILPVSGNGCVGDTMPVTLTVRPEPVLDPALNDTVCSNMQSGILLKETAGSVQAVVFDIPDITADYGLSGATGNAIPGQGLAADTIYRDVFTNTTALPLNVNYQVVPVSAEGCKGEPVTVTLTVNPEPGLDPGLNATICSGDETGISLAVIPSGVAAASFNILNIDADPSLVPDPDNATPGTDLPADTIMNDRFTNTTNIPLLVKYDVVPVSAAGCEGQMHQVIVTVQPEPVLTAGPGETVCSGEMTSILLSNANNVPGTRYTWSTPVNTGGMTGGTAGTSSVIVDAFTNNTGTPQTATYRVVPVSGMGCPGDTGTVIVTVNPKPQADILGDGVAADSFRLCGSHDLVLDGNPSGGSGSYTTHLWKGNTGPLDNVNTQSVIFNSQFSGTFTLVYSVTDNNGCKGSDQVTINVDSPKAIFSADNIAGCDQLTVHFTNNSIGSAGYIWDFGDGSPTETTPSPVHDFDNLTTQIQYFEVKLIAESANGCRDSMMQTITVYPTVEASFYITPDTICHGDPAVMLVAGPGASAYYWDYGDGNTEYAGNVTTHDFTNTGTDIVTRTVTLTTESFYSCKDTATYEVTVYPMPVPGFTPTPATQTWPNSQVTFNNQTNTGSWSYSWNFGDGGTSTETSPVHNYDAPGDYTVVLTVRNDHCTDSISKTVEIKPVPPVANFEQVPPACNPYTVDFVNTSENATSYLWDFGDGSVTDDENPQHTFYEAGTYDVRLTATGPGGTDQYLQMITVYRTPTSFLGVTPDTVYVGVDKVKCFNLSTYGDYYVWEFGDGDTSTMYEPFHQYEEPGIYDITLKVYTYQGCEASYTMAPAVWVLEAGDIMFATAFRPNKNGPTGGHKPPPGQINTVFFPPVHQQIDDYHLQIFDRWGELIFESFDINIGWDGYYKGKLCQQGVYVWKVEGKYANGRPYRKAGDITLLH